VKVKELLRAKGNQVVTILPQNTLLEAARRLTEHGIGALLVLAQDGSIEGIITERDLTTVSAEQEGNLGSALVQDAMSTNLLIGLPEDNLDYILGIMTQNRIRHVPIVDQGKLEGIISIGDVVKARLQETEVKNRYLEDYIYGNYPE
jgi:signal-transduction protein with cAMP-binding, CBS, and nucleotidyltransferase domain